ncbi:hypothetical protein FZEAL_4681 [Fusarium zealandicum]|uniref:Uncharacterized protein n=1 Tax=Fusarium zealandicum TaxID=1053134 RepID=A0A8H4ULP7_9HYPO|nr:hypothetical protein FZEAL_4681 [Fusarium zealandicum]
MYVNFFVAFYRPSINVNKFRQDLELKHVRLIGCCLSDKREDLAALGALIGHEDKETAVFEVLVTVLQKQSILSLLQKNTISDGAPKRPSASLRSHAVKSGLQRKSQKATPSGPRDSQLTIRQKETLKGRFRISTEPNKQRPSSQSTKKKQVQDGRSNVDETLSMRWDLVRAPSQGRGDPFGAFPIQMRLNDDELIRFFVSRFDLRATIAYIRKEWWQVCAFSDPLMMHTTLGLAAALWSQLLPDPSLVATEGCRHKALALRGVQERLSSGLHDMALIGTIANLANIEGTEGNYKVACLHLKALDLLIRARRGYDELKDNVNVARVINWSDVQAAIGLGTAPLLPIILTMDSVSLPLDILVAAQTPSLGHLAVFETSLDATTIRDSFSLVRQAQYSLKSRDVPIQDFRVVINVVDHHLQTTLGGGSLSDHGRILLTAAHAIFYLTVRELHPTHRLPRTILRRLRQQLEGRTTLLYTWPEFQQGLLWCLVVGAAAAYESGEDWDFFSANISMVLELSDIRDISQLKDMLSGFIWHDRYPGEFLDQYGTVVFSTSLA